METAGSYTEHHCLPSSLHSFFSDFHLPCGPFGLDLTLHGKFTVKQGAAERVSFVLQGWYASL